MCKLYVICDILHLLQVGQIRDVCLARQYFKQILKTLIFFLPELATPGFCIRTDFRVQVLFSTMNRFSQAEKNVTKLNFIQIYDH